MGSIYYIDGYNVIHHSRTLKPLAMQHFEAARDALVEQVARFCTTTGNKAVVVFDGRSSSQFPQTQFPPIAGLEIKYSSGRQSADAFIERQVYTTLNRREIVVVSADRGIRNLCGILGAVVMGPDNFLAGTAEADRDMSAALKQIHRKQKTDDSLEDRLRKRDKEHLSRLREKLRD